MLPEATVSRHGATADMSAEQTTSLIERKARAGRDVQAARAMSLGRALRITAAKQGEQMMSLALAALGVTRRICPATEAAQSLDAGALILMMDGPAAQVAVAVIEPAVVIGLIQQQTMGRIFPPQKGDSARVFTQTDATLCAPFIEALMRQAAVLPDDEAERSLLAGYRFGVLAQGPRQAQLVLDANDYEVIEMTLDMAAGARVGKLVLILPEPMPTRIETEDAVEHSATTTPIVTLAETVLSLQADLMVALTRLTLPLQRMSALKEGDLLDLNLSTMAQALVIDGNGRAVSRGTLGQIDGVRALQVEQKQSQHYAQPRRRASDRDELDLPDVTVGSPSSEDRRAPPDVPAPDLLQMADVDIFGNLDSLPDLPDMDQSAAGADTEMSRWLDPDGDAVAQISQKRSG